jgi:hypothetical protein
MLHVTYCFTLRYFRHVSVRIDPSSGRQIRIMYHVHVYYIYTIMVHRRELHVPLCVQDIAAAGMILVSL